MCFFPLQLDFRGSGMPQLIVLSLRLQSRQHCGSLTSLPQIQEIYTYPTSARKGCLSHPAPLLHSSSVVRSLFRLPPPIRILVMTSDPPQIIQDCLFLSSSRSLIASAKSLVPCKAVYSQAPGIRVWISFVRRDWALFCLAQVICRPHLEEKPQGAVFPPFLQ